MWGPGVIDGADAAGLRTGGRERRPRDALGTRWAGAAQASVRLRILREEWRLEEAKTETGRVWA